MEGWKQDKRKVEWKDGSRIKGWKNKWKGGRMEGWNNGRMDGRIEGWKNDRMEG